MRLPTLCLVTALVAAGCLAPDDEPDDGSSATPPPSYRLECAIADGNASWPEACLAMASPNPSPSKTEIDLAVNPTDPENVVVASKDNDPLASDCVWAVAQASLDGGESWTTSYLGGKLDERAPGDPLWGWRCITDPIMAFDAAGTLYYSIQAYDHTIRDNQVPDPIADALPVGPTFGSSILAARSTDGGVTWDKYVTLHVGDGSSVFHDYMRVLVNPATQTYHTIWNQFTQPATVIPVLVSWDGAADAARPPTYIPVPDVPMGTTMAGFAAKTDGTMFVLIDAGDVGYLTSSTDDGQTFSAPTLIEQTRRVPLARQAFGPDAFRTTGSYELAIDNSGGARDGWLYATISDYANDDANLYLTRSEDGGATWTEKVLMHPGNLSEGFQWMTRPYVDRLGTLHAVYLSTQRDPEHQLIDAWWAWSEDGGQTWNNTRLTDVLSDGNLGVHQDGFAFYGDYVGIGGAGDYVYMGFPSTATGVAEIAVAKVRLPTR